MANIIDPELYPDNNAHSTAHPTRWQLDNAGVPVQVPITGLTDLRIYLSTAATTPTHTHESVVHADLVEVMAEKGTTAAYEATLLGSALRERVALADGAALHVHWQSLTAGYHETVQVTWRTARPAEA